MQSRLRYSSPTIPGMQILSCQDAFAFENHLHSGHVLWLNSEGAEEYSLKGRTEILQPGSICVIEPEVIHSNRPCKKEYRHLRSIYLEPDFFYYLERLCTGSATGGFSLPTAVYTRQRYWHLAIALHEAILSGREKLLVDELLLTLFTALGNPGPRAESKIFDNKSKDLLNVIDYMHASPEKNPPLERLAGIAGCTSYHLIRLFKKHIGLAPHAYLIQLRLEKAKKLLDKGLPIAESALSAGFSDQSHLTRRFKKRYGLTPGAYLQQQKL